MRSLLVRFSYWILAKYGHIKEVDIHKHLYFQGFILNVKSMTVIEDDNIMHPAIIKIEAEEVLKP